MNNFRWFRIDDPAETAPFSGVEDDRDVQLNSVVRHVYGLRGRCMSGLSFSFLPRSLFLSCEMFYLNDRVEVEIKLTLSRVLSLSSRRLTETELSL